MKHFLSLHSHSRYSSLDGMTPVESMVDKAVRLGQGGIGLTDHGNMAGAIQLYKACRAEDILPFPGLEAYLVQDHTVKDAKRYHLGLLALDYEGYTALVKLTSLSHTRPHFHIKPRIDMADLAALHESGASEHISLLSGCYFGLVQQTLVYKGPKAAEAVLRTYASWFPHTFVEIQHHNTDHTESDWSDDKLAIALYKLANKLGLPVVVTQDCHYLDQSERHEHTMMKRLTIHAKDVDSGDVGFPGDSYHLASAKWVGKHYDKPRLREIPAAADESFHHLLMLNDLVIPALETYQFRVPEIAKNPDSKLVKMAKKALVEMGLDKPKYRARMEYELGIIKETGFANYFLLVRRVIDFCEKNGIVVQARGSANGFLVCYLLGITQCDSIRWDLDPAGFLTRDRSKPPDIDLDIQKDRRDEVAEWVSSEFNAVQIGTWGRLGWDEEAGVQDKGKGSLFVKYLSTRRNELGDEEFKRRYPNKLSPFSIKEYEPEDYAKLSKLSDMQVVKGAGSHAAGFVLDHDGLLNEIIPTMLIASSNRTVTQPEMDDLEDAGFVKVDLLGLRTLASVARTLELMNTDWSFMENIPFDDRAVYRAIGRTKPGNGTFQLEGWTTAKGVRQMKPRSIKEVIEAMALFRPAMAESGYRDVYLYNRNHTDEIDYIHDVTEKHLKSTYGVALYSEQIIAICRDLGMEPEDVQRLVKAAKVKHGKAGISAASTRAFEGAERFFIDAATEHMDDMSAREIWNLIVGFQRYGFKKSHATPYGILAYRTAWLRYHFPHEFCTALLEVVSWADQKKEPDYERMVREYAFEEILPRYEEGHFDRSMTFDTADVNESGATWTLNPKTGTIRKGLLSIKGVGLNAAKAIAEGQPWSSVDHMIDTIPAKIVTGGKSWAKERTLNGTYHALQQAGALEAVGVKPTKCSCNYCSGKK